MLDSFNPKTLRQFSVRVFGLPSDLAAEMPTVSESTGRVRVFARDPEDAARRACVMLANSEVEGARDAVEAAEHVLVWKLTYGDGTPYPQSEEGAAPTVVTGPAYNADVAIGDDYAMAAINS